MTTASDFSLAGAGLPTEREIETLAGSLLAGDAAGFDANVCASGIEGLLTNGDTAVIDRAAQKVQEAAGAFGGFGVPATATPETFSPTVTESASLAQPQTAIAGGYTLGALDGYEAVVQSLAADYAASAAREQNGAGARDSTPAGARDYAPSVSGDYAPTAALEQTAQSAQSPYGVETPAQVASPASAYAPTVLSLSQAEEQDKHGANAGGSDGHFDRLNDRAGAEQGADERLSATSAHTVIGTKTLGEIRADFPILRERVNGNPLVWLDNGATTQRPKAVIDRLVHYYEHENSNVHRGVHELADRSTDAMEKARKTVADFIGAPSAENIVFVRGTTEAINLVANAYVKQYLAPGDEIILTLLEHHANIVPWQLIAQETGAVIKVAPIDESGQIILSEYEKLFTPRTKFASTTQVSNALGTITPVAEMIQIAHRHGVRILIDGAQSVAHIPVNVSALDADFFVFSGHKIYSPTGVGVVYGKKELLAAAKPYQGGGNMIRDVTFERTVYNEAPAKFEAGTAAIAQIVGLGAALEYVGGIGIADIGRYEHELTQYALGEMRKIPGLHLVGNATAKAGVLSFVLDGHDIFEVGEYLNRFGIAVRSGHHCAQPVLRHYGLEGTVRPTLAVYNSPEDVDAMVKALWSLSAR